MGYQVSLSTSASQNEGNPAGTAAAFTFDLTRDAGDQGNTNYTYTIFTVDSNGTVTGVADDFTTSTLAFVWGAGLPTKQVTITANLDTTVEANETFQVLFSRVGAGDFSYMSPTLTLVNDDAGPPVFSTPTAITAAENGTAVVTVAASGSGTTYTLTGGAADNALFALDANTGVLTFLAPKNFEAPDDAGPNGVYDIQVTATAGGASTAQNIAVTLTNVNEAITNTTGAAFGVAENVTTITTGTATDIDAGDTVTWSISGGVDASAFAVDSTTGALSFVSGRNFEAPTDNGANNTYVVDLRATDSGGLTSTQTVTVTVANAAEPSVINSLGGASLAVLHVSENTTAAVTTVAATDDDGNAVTYSVGGPDAGAFAIDANTGVLTFNPSPNYEAPTAVGGGNTYDVNVIATSAGGADTQRLLVIVDNVIEAGVPSDLPGAGGGGGGGGGGGPPPGGGTSGDDVLAGTAGADYRTGGDGNDTISADDGDDLVDGDNGNDLILGGDGNDFIRGLNDDDTVSGGAGADTVNGNLGNDVVDGGAGADSVYGGQGNDAVEGGDGDDVYVNGNIGNDIVHGGAGSDSVYGGQNDDLVYGDAGDDRVSGDLGNDLLFGGAGADRFAFAKTGGQDWVGDFNGAEGDRILLAPGTTFTLTSFAGQVVIDLGGGDLLGLAGVSPGSFDASWIIFG